MRLVIFDYQGGWPLQLYNEKALCGLGIPVAKTGYLGEKAQNDVIALLQRYGEIARGLGADKFMIVATAAMRDAKDSRQFLKRVKSSVGVDIQIISGEEEARLSAIGVKQAFHQVHGVMGDLGGSSLEIVPILKKQAIENRVSLPLGPLQLRATIGEDLAAIKAATTDYLNEIPWLRKVPKGIDFYPVGGAWRTLAKLHMEQIDYPLRLIQGYRLTHQQMMSVCRQTQQAKSSDLALIKGVSKRRAANLPQTAAVLEAVLDFLQSKEIVFSTFGLREGYLHDHLSPIQQDLYQDSLLSACHSLAQQESRTPDLWQSLYDWTAPLFRHHTGISDRIRQAICMLSDCGWQENPDYRANGFSRHILQLPLTGISHQERIQIALCLYVRYQGDGKHRANRLADQFLSPEMHQSATMLGHILHLAYILSGGVSNLLSPHQISFTRNQILELKLAYQIPDHISKEMDRNLQAAAKAMAMQAEVTLKSA